MKKKCLVCGGEYEVCPHCEKIKEMNPWRAVVCSPSHFPFHLAIIGYARGMLTREEARDELMRAVELYGEVKYSESVRRIVGEILSGSESDNSMEGNS